MNNFEVYPIGVIQNSENGTAIQIEPKYIPAMKALEGFSHINIIWWFSGFDNKDARNTLETPCVPEWCSHWPKSLEESACFNWENEFNF